MADPIAEYTVREFSAVDNQIEEIAKREKVVTQKLWLANQFQMIKFAVIAMGAIGLFLILLAIAYRIAFPAEKTIIKETLVQQKLQRGASSDATPPARVWGNTGSTSQGETYSANKKEFDETKNKSKESAIGERSVTTFTTVEANITGLNDVVTGWRWDDVSATSPSHEYCYVTSPGTNGISKRVDIAFKTPGSLSAEDLYSFASSNALGLSKGQWNRLLDKCRWSKF